MSQHAIQFQNYSFCYENTETQVLSDVNIVLDYGQIAVLAGRSGSGKSTLLYSINGVIPYSTPGEITGDILVDGQSIKEKKTAERAALIGSVLQNAEAQIVHEIIEDEIAFPCENLSFPPEKIAERIQYATDLMNLDPSDATRTLSGGQKQKLITAATLAMEQKILLLDEPLANLDIAGAAKLMQTLKMLAREENYAILVVEHRMDMVLPYADRVFVLENGKVTETTAENLSDEKEDVAGRKNIDASTGQIMTAEHLSYTVKEKEILKDVSFSAAKGERIVILGENGCGKTTLLKLLAGLLKPSAGQVSQTLLPNGKMGSSAWFKKVGVVEQNPDYQLFMPTVQEEIGYGAVSEEWKEEILHRFALDAVRLQHPQSLSEGQKRKCSLGAILAMQPELLLLDEPTVGQDANSLEQMIKILDDFQQEFHMTQIIVTHDRSFAKNHAERVIWLKDGSIHMDGGPEVCKAYFDYMKQ